jgi:hypothetical protein
MPVISAFCSPDRGVRGVEVTLGWGLGVERVVRLGVLLLDFALVTGVLFVLRFFDRVEVERGFAFVFRLFWVMISS